MASDVERCVLGLDFGTNSVRCVIVSVSDGRELSTASVQYRSGDQGVITSPQSHDLARQSALDYLEAMKEATKNALSHVRAGKYEVIGIGVDTTGSTPGPIDKECRALSELPQFKNELDAHFWLWKDHTAHAEAREITDLAKKMKPEYLLKCGGAYSAEWYWSKILHCLRTNRAVFDAAFSWVECCDYIAATLAGISSVADIKRSRCAAGHKAMYSDEWGGLPSKEFLSALDPALGVLRDRLYNTTYTSDVAMGGLCKLWAENFGLPVGIPVAVGAIDAHFGAVGCGVSPGKFVKIIGTSTCDICVWPKSQAVPDIRGVCGIVDGSVIPGFMALEAGQSAVGDIFKWFVDVIQPGGSVHGSHEELTAKAALLQPGQSGLLALDWNNGNRNILVDQRLTGLILGQTLHTKPEEIYRALIEATAFGARMIIDHVQGYDICIDEVINCGGIAEKNPLLMQIYADVIGKEMKVAMAKETCALGAAISVDRKRGGYDNFLDAQAAMVVKPTKIYKPDPESRAVYNRLFKLYRDIHDAFGLPESRPSLFPVMKTLLEIRDSVGKH